MTELHPSRGLELTKAEARDAVDDFYVDIDNEWFNDAWERLTASTRSEFGSLAVWRDGHDSRTDTDLRSTWVEPLDATSSLVHVDLTTTDVSDCDFESDQYFSGTWVVAEADGERLLAEPNIELVRGQDPVLADERCAAQKHDRHLARIAARQTHQDLLAQQAAAEAASEYGTADPDGEYDSEYIDTTPETLDGSSSDEFEPDDIERAVDASPEVQEYCSGAVSEAQYIGCLSHVDEWDIP